MCRVGQAGKVGKNPTQMGSRSPRSFFIKDTGIFEGGSGFLWKIWGDASLSPLSDGTL